MKLKKNHLVIINQLLPFQVWVITKNSLKRLENALIQLERSYTQIITNTLDKDLEDMHGIAGKALAKLITTEKDFVRLSKKQKQNITPLLIKIVFDKEINL